MEVTAGAASIRGKGRSINEDALKLYLEQPVVKRAARGALFVVADGEGPDGNGRQLSWAAVDALSEFYEIPPEDFTPGTGLRRAFDHVSEALTALAVREPRCATAQTTLTVMYTTPSADRGVLVTIGDSPVYVIHREKLALVSGGWASAPAQSRLIPGASPKASHRALKFTDGDVFLICTKGVTEHAKRHALEEYLNAWTHPADVAGDLVDLALSGGALYDATALVVRFGLCPGRRPAEEGR